MKTRGAFTYYSLLIIKELKKNQLPAWWWDGGSRKRNINGTDIRFHFKLPYLNIQSKV